ncbi:MAG: GHKL domain-containing protein [Oscillospiraceae bacterium]|jgi:sensor histidine kinase regulating citrate/malate metabolism|nr:GHKL domain-containing protein [Oscillospiraceae bacterium]
MMIAKRTEKRIAELQRELMERHIEEVQNIYKDMRGWRHDYRNHIQTMKSYIALGGDGPRPGYDKLDKYLDRLDEDLTSVDKLIKSGNLMLDAILNSKLSLAQARKISVEAKAAAPAELKFNDVDLCVVIGNLLDNAMEACAKLEDESARFIRVYIDLKRGQLYISVTNSTAGRPKKLLGRYVTDKPGGFHGLGLTRVDRIVSKYAGWLKRRDEDSVFTTEIMLPVGE